MSGKKTGREVKQSEQSDNISTSTYVLGAIAILVSLYFILPTVVTIVTYYSQPLENAILRGDIDAIKKAISNGANVNATNSSSGRTMLTLASRYGRHSEELMLRTPELRLQTIRKMLETLIDAGADVNVLDRHQCTALFLVTNKPYDRHPASAAAVKEYKKLVAMLIGKGADVNLRYVDGRTPLHNAIMKSVEADNLEIVELLIESGADINATAMGQTAFKLATNANKKKIAELLRKHGAKE